MSILHTKTSKEVFFGHNQRCPEKKGKNIFFLQFERLWSHKIMEKSNEHILWNTCIFFIFLFFKFF